MENSVEVKESPWIIARRGIKLLLHDKNREAEILFVTSPPGIQITAGICFVTFMNALMCFDDGRVTEAISQIKKIEEQCVHQIGWVKSFKNKIFTSNEETKTLEQSLEEKIVLADSLVCQSFLTFLQNDFTSYMKGGWTLRRAWKVYQHTHEQLSAIHKHMFGNRNVSGWSFDEIQSPSSSSNNIKINKTPNDNQNIHSPEDRTDSPTLEIDEEDEENPNKVKNVGFYTSKTFSDFTVISNGKIEKDAEEINDGCDSKQSQNSSPTVRPNKLNFKPSNGDVKQPLSCDNCVQNQTTMQKSVSLFSSLNTFSSAILESASSLIGFNKEPDKDWQNIEPETVLRLMSAVSFGYGVFRLCVSLAPPSILRWINMLGFEGDQTAAIKSLHYSRKGTDMRAPLASLALLWYHTIVRPFFNLDGVSSKQSIEEATKILEEEVEYANSALFLFFKGRVERLKSNIAGAIEAYETSVSKAALPEVKLLGLHEVGWCHLLTLNYKEAHGCFSQLKQQSKWSKSFYAYLTTICAGSMGNSKLVLPGKSEIKYFIEKSANKGAQIEKYIRRRMEKLPESKEAEKDWVKDPTHWQLYCYEMLYLWNTFPSCNSSDLLAIIATCTPNNGKETVNNEPMRGISWLIRGSAMVVLANRSNHKNNNNPPLDIQENSAAYYSNAVQAFRTCLQIRSKCSTDAHVSAFAQYELALLLLRDSSTRPEGKNLLMKLQYLYRDYDFEHRLIVRVNATLKSVEKYESQKKNE